jgi:hypothetical protein
MGWFERQVGSRSPDDVSREHARYIRASRVVDALDRLAGPFGCRRFLVRFEYRGGSVQVTDLQAVPLGWGGGPPPHDDHGRLLGAVEKALQRLHANMAMGPAWNRGVLAYVRDANGVTEINPAFDDDSDAADLDSLPVPGPPGHPLEDPSTHDLFALRRRDIQRVQATTRTKAADWDWWEVDDDGRLVLHYEQPDRDRSLRCTVLATHETHVSRFTWRTDRPLGAAAVFQGTSFASTFEASMELGLLACAMLDAEWLFVQPYDDRGGQLLVAVYR